MELSEIKQCISIETVPDHYSLHPDRHHFIKCPFHCYLTIYFLPVEPAPIHRGHTIL